MKKVLIVLMILCSASLAFSVASYDALGSSSWAIPSINSPYYSYPYYAPPTVPITSALPSRPAAVVSAVPYAYTPYPAQMAPVYPVTYAAPAVYGSPYVISQTTTYYSRGYVTAPVPVYPYSVYPYTPYYYSYSYPYVYPTRVIY